MLQTRYLVSHSGQQQGPFSQAEITSKIFSHELLLCDYIFDELEGHWIMIVMHPAFTDMVHFEKPVKVPADENQLPLHQKEHNIEWFILKGQNRFGPYAFLDIVKLLQSRSLFEYDYAWNPSLETWQLIADLPEFKAEKIKELQTSTLPEVSHIFFRRRHARANYGASLIIHNNSQIWKGKTFEISPGGAGIELESGRLQIGQILNIHFKPADEVPPFNAKCEIVSQRTSGEEKTKKVIYGIKFLEVSEQTQVEISQFTVTHSRAA